MCTIDVYYLLCHFAALLLVASFHVTGKHCSVFLSVGRVDTFSRGTLYIMNVCGITNKFNGLPDVLPR
jgi:hypothetical protein